MPALMLLAEPAAEPAEGEVKEKPKHKVFFVVSKNIFPKAHDRNRLKRLQISRIGTE